MVFILSGAAMREQGKMSVATRTWLTPTLVLCVLLVLLALGGRAVLAQIGPRHVVNIDAGRQALAGPLSQGRIQQVGDGLALISYQGLNILTVSADAGAYSADAVPHWPAADVLVLTPARVGRYDGLAPLAALRAMNVVLVEPAHGVAAPSLPPEGGPRFYPLHTWDALHLRKGRTQLRVTAMPGAPGTVQVAGLVLEIGDGRASYRIYLSCEGLADEQWQALSARLPGADVALWPASVEHAQQNLLLLPLRQGPQAQPVPLTATGQLFSAVRR